MMPNTLTNSKLKDAILEQINETLDEVKQSARQAVVEEQARLAEEERSKKEEEARVKAEEAAKPDLFDELDIFDTVDENTFKPYVAPPRVEVKITDEIRALIAEQVAAAIAAIPQPKPETRIIEKTIKMPEKVIVKELVDNSADIIKSYEKKIKAAIDEYDKSGRAGPIIIPNQRSNDAYRPSNVTITRNFDATLTSLDEIASVLGSLIKSLQGAGVIK